MWYMPAIRAGISFYHYVVSGIFPGRSNVLIELSEKGRIFEWRKVFELVLVVVVVVVVAVILVIGCNHPRWASRGRKC